MRSVRFGIALVAAVGVGWSGTPVAKAQEEPTPVNTTYFFRCVDGGTKLHNTWGAAPWSTTAPAQSYAAGGGCGFLAAGAGLPYNQSLVEARFQGEHTGPVSSLSVELHELLAGQVQSSLTGNLTFSVGLEIDGSPVLDGARVAATPVRSDSGLTQSIRFSVARIPVTDGEVHHYRLTIRTVYADTAYAWVFGATEIPSKVEFNPVRLSPSKIYVG